MVFFHHRITLSALASTLGGIGNPICLAAFRLIKNSNFVGCSTGKSPAWLLSEFCPRRSRRADNSQAHSVHRTSGHQRLHTCLRRRLQATVSWQQVPRSAFDWRRIVRSDPPYGESVGTRLGRPFERPCQIIGSRHLHDVKLDLQVRGRGRESTLRINNPRVAGFNCTRFHLWSFLGVGPQRDFHQTLVRLTTRRSGDIAPVTEKGCLKFLYVPRSEHEHMDIVIIGGGIGGLTLALSLHLRGIPCRVYESAPEVKELGVGITLLPHGMRELTALGLGEALATQGIENRDSCFFNRFGQLIYAEPCGRAAGYPA